DFSGYVTMWKLDSLHPSTFPPLYRLPIFSPNLLNVRRLMFVLVYLVLLLVLLFPSLLVLFLSHSPDVLRSSVFTTIYIVAYSTQSPNIALLSCLLRTLGIVTSLSLNTISCLLRTLAV